MKHRPALSMAVPVTFFFLLGASMAFSQGAGLPPGEGAAMQKLNSTPRHGEWVTVDAGNGDKVDAWVVYPERSDKAPVVLVIHEIFGLSDWIRAVADQLAAEGFIAVAPDFLSGKAPGGKGSRGLTVDEARALNSVLDPAEVVRRLNAVAKYATSLPAALPRYGVVGFCWGGGMSFAYATEQPALGAAVVYYGTSPATPTLSRVRAPVLGLYGGSDARVGATVPPAAEEMKRLGKSFEYAMFDGAGHGFLRAQDGQSGANMKAVQQAWPRTIQFLKKNLGSAMSRDNGREELLLAVASLKYTCNLDHEEPARTAFATVLRDQID